MPAGKNIKHVVAKFKFQYMEPFEVEYHNLDHMAKELKIKNNTLRKIVYDKQYKTKKYDDFLKHIDIILIQ